jgi:membrane protease YdiL (CAAX protease family)
VTDAEAAPRWGILDAAVGYLVGYALASLATAAWSAATGVEPGRRTLGVTVAAVAGLWTGLLGAAAVAARRKGSGSLADDFGFRFRARDLPLGFAAGTATQVAVVVLYRLAGWEGAGRENEELVDATHGVGLVVLYLLLAVGAPMVEELFFRGFLQRALVRQFGPAVGIAGAALVFALTHFDLEALPGLILFGVVLGVLAHRTGRLGAAVVAHVLFNAVAVAVYLVR